MQLTPMALQALAAGYLRRDAGGEIVETPEGMYRRVAHCVARGEVHYGGEAPADRWEEAFFQALADLDFLPCGTTLMNAGTPVGQLAPCVVLPVEDTLEEIFEALKRMAVIQQSGAGAGLGFSHLRSRGERAAATGSMASGPASFLSVFEVASAQLQQGGRRRGRNLAVLHIEHADILEFLAAGGADPGAASPAVIPRAVAVPDSFFEAAARGGTHALRDPHSKQTRRSLPAPEMLTQLAEAALRSGGQVGLLFLDTINRHNPTPAFGQIEASSPCYAVPLLGHEACVLGAVNLGHMVRAQASGVAVDWQRLERTVRLGIRFLDDVLEVGRWPTSWVASMVRANRKVGLGVMGFADLLIELGIPYGSPQSVTLADSLMSAIAAEAQAASQQLGRERGVFPGHSHSVYARAELRLRNATRLAIAPAASISVIAGVAPGIEPLGALAHYGAAGLNGKGGTVPHPILVRHAERAGLSEARLREELAAGALTDSGSLPTALRELFRTAPQIHPHDHLAIQAAFQKHVDNAVAKQIYMPVTATPRDLAVLYRRAWELGCKGLQLRRAAYQGPPATGAAT